MPRNSTPAFRSARLIPLTVALLGTLGPSAALGQSNGGLKIEFRRLGDSVAKNLEKVDGDLRYQRFAVMPFQEAGEKVKAKQLGLLLYAQLSARLLNDHNILLVERERLKDVIEELALAQSGLINEKEAAKVGELTGAHALITGTVAQAGPHFLVTANVISVETGQILSTSEVSLPQADLVALSSDAVVLRTSSGATFRSFLVPGWGQTYNRQPVKASLFLGTELLAGSIATFLHYKGAQFEKQYSNAQVGGNFSTRERAELKYEQRNIALAIVGAIHVLNIVDAYLSGPDSRSLQSSGGSGVVFSW